MTEKLAHLDEGIEPIEVQFHKGAWVYDDECYHLRQGGCEVLSPREGFVSGVDGSNKFTDQLISCTSVVGVGTGEVSDVSFMTHQDVVAAVSGDFLWKLEHALRELVERTRDKTRDVVIAAGKLPISIWDGGSREYIYTQPYKDAILMLADVVAGELGFYPRIVGPISCRRGHLELYSGLTFNNDPRALHVTRHGDRSMKSVDRVFELSEIDEVVDRMCKAWNVPLFQPS